MRSAPGYGGGFSISVSATPYMKMTAPRPRPSTPEASAVNPGARLRPETADFSSSMKPFMWGPSGLRRAALRQVDHVRLVDDTAVEELDLAVRIVGVARIVGHHADRRALAVQLAQEVHHRLAVPRVEVPGGLVGEQDRGLARERAGDGHALLLAAGELRRVVVHSVRHADALKRMQRGFAA